MLKSYIFYSTINSFRICNLLFQEELNSNQEIKHNDFQEDDPETKCGFYKFHADWLQTLASKKSYIVVYGLIGMFQLAVGSYFIASISTLEKRFKIPSKTSGRPTIKNYLLKDIS